MPDHFSAIAALDPTPALFWSKRGEVACGRHAPSRDGLRWAAEEWRALQPVSQRVTYQCTTCHGSPVRHSRRTRRAEAHRPPRAVPPADILPGSPMSSVSDPARVETCWRFEGATGRIVECAVFRTQEGLEIRVGYGVTEVIRVEPVLDVAEARDRARRWRRAMVNSHFAELDAV